MLDLVQTALTTGNVDKQEVFRTAVTTIVLQSSDDVYSFLSRHNNQTVRVRVSSRISYARLVD